MRSMPGPYPGSREDQKSSVGRGAWDAPSGVRDVRITDHFGCRFMLHRRQIRRGQCRERGNQNNQVEACPQRGWVIFSRLWC